MIEFIKDNAKELIDIVAYVVAVFSMIANFTKTDVDNKVAEKLTKLVAALALNFKSPSVDKIETK